MDEIVSACQFRDAVIIVTRRGKVYLMSYEPISMQVQFRLISEIPLHP